MITEEKHPIRMLFFRDHALRWTYHSESGANVPDGADVA
jgi:hypothetical protein